MLTLLAKILGALSSDTRPLQLSLAFGFAFLIGFNGFLSLVGLAVIALLFIVRVNLSIFLAMSAVFGVLSLLLSPLTAGLGKSLLTEPTWAEMWTSLYNTYWFRVFELNNTLELGAAVFSLFAFVPVVVVAHWLVLKYRKVFMDWVSKFKVVQTLKASKFYRIYEAVHG